MANTRPPTAVVEQRILEIKKELLQGRTRSDILRHTASWGLASRTIDDYMAWATEEIKEINAQSYDETLAQVSSCWWDLYRTGDDKTKATALANLAKIKGLDQVNVNHFLKDERLLTDKTDAELDELLGGGDARDTSIK